MSVFKSFAVVTFAFFATVAAAADDASVAVGDDGADRNLAGGRRFFCQRECFSHCL